MSDDATRLAKYKAAADALLDVLTDTTVVEYYLPGGRRIRRPEFGPTLKAIEMEIIPILEARVARAAGRGGPRITLAAPRRV